MESSASRKITQPAEKIEELRSLLQQFGDAHQSLSQQISTLRDGAAPTWSEWMSDKIGLPTSPSKTLSSSTPLISKTTQKQKTINLVGELNGWFTPVEKILGEVAASSKQLLDALNAEQTTLKNVSTFIKECEQLTRDSFVADLKHCQAVVATAKRNVQQLFNNVEGLIHSYPALEKYNQEFVSLVEKARTELSEIEANIKALQLSQEKNQLKANVNLIESIPPLETIKEFLDLESMCLHIDGQLMTNFMHTEDWKEDWYLSDPHASSMQVFKQVWPDFQKMLLELEATHADKQTKYKAAFTSEKAKVYNEVESNLSNLTETRFMDYRLTLIELIKPLLSKKKILTLEEKAQQISRVEKAFDSMLDDMNKQSEKVLIALANIEAHMSDMPEQPFVGLDELRKDEQIENHIYFIDRYYEEYHRLNDYSTKHMKYYARKYGNEHVINLLAILQNIISKKTYQAICAQAGVSSDLRFIDIIRANRDTLDNISKPHIDDWIARLNQGPYFSLWRLLSASTGAIRELGGGEDARKVLQTGMKFLEDLEHHYVKGENVRKQEKNTANTWRDTRHTLLSEKASLVNRYSSQKKLAEKYDIEELKKQLTEQQYNISTHIAELKNKWMDQRSSSWVKDFHRQVKNRYSIKKCFDAICLCINTLRDDIQRLKGFPAQAMLDQSPQYNAVVTAYNELLGIAKKLMVVVDGVNSIAGRNFIENASPLALFMKEVGETLKGVVEHSQDLLTHDLKNACATMNNDIEASTEWYPQLTSLDKSIERFARVVPGLEADAQMFDDLVARMEQQMGLIGSPKIHVQTHLSAYDIDEWFKHTVSKFKQYYAAYIKEEKKRQTFAERAEQFSPLIQANLAFITEVKTVLDRVREVDKLNKEGCDKYNSFASELQSKSDRMSRALKCKLQSNERSQALIRQLKNTVLEQLAGLDQSNQYNRQLVLHILNDLMFEDAKIWLLLDHERKNIEFHKISLSTPERVEEVNAALPTHKALKAACGEFLAVVAAPAREDAYYLEDYSLDKHRRMAYSFLHDELKSIKNDCELLFDVIDDAYNVGNLKISQGKEAIDKKTAAMVMRFSSLQRPLVDNVNTLKKQAEPEVNKLLQVLTRESKAVSAYSEKNTAFKADITNMQYINQKGFFVSTKAEFLISLPLVEEIKVRMKSSMAVPDTTFISTQLDLNLFKQNLKKALAENSVMELGVLDAQKILLVSDIQNIVGLLGSANSKVETDKFIDVDISLLKEEKYRLLKIQQKQTRALQEYVDLFCSENIKISTELHLFAKHLKNEKLKFEQVNANYLALLKDNKDLMTKKTGYTDQFAALSLMFNKILKMIRVSMENNKNAWIDSMKEYRNIFDVNQLERDNQTDLETMRLIFARLLDSIENIVEEYISAEDLLIYSDQPLSDLTPAQASERNYALLKKIRVLAVEVKNKISHIGEEAVHGYLYSISAEKLQYWMQGAEILAEYYNEEMKKIHELLHWLSETNARVLSLMPVIQEVGFETDMRLLNEWFKSSYSSFMDEYEQVVVREKLLNEIDQLIKDLQDVKSSHATLAERKAELESQKATMQSHSTYLDDLRPRIVKRQQEMNELNTSKHLFDEARSALVPNGDFTKVTGVVFKRFKHLFFLDENVNQILTQLAERAKKYQDEKVEKGKATLNFLQSLAACDSNLNDFLGLVQFALKTNAFSTETGEISLLTTSGAARKTRELLEELNTAMLRMIQTSKTTLFLDDQDADFAERSVRVNDFTFIDDPKTAENISSNQPLFDFLYKRITGNLNNTPTKKQTALNDFRAALATINHSGNDEYTKLKDLKEKLETALVPLGGGIALFKSRRLEKALKAELIVVGQLLASYPIPAAPTLKFDE